MVKLRTSLLNGRFEDEVENLVVTLECEFGFQVESVVVKYRDLCEGERDDIIVHTFRCPTGEANFEED